MIKLTEVINALKQNKIDFVTGVPDSLFKDLCKKFDKEFKKKHLIAANEGSAIGLGIGYYLAKGKLPLIYLQNSGLGNTFNPLISLADKKIYRIPLFLLIGWRGEVIKKNEQIDDEPQHKKQGLITEKLLKSLDIKYKIINKESNFKKIFYKLKNYAIKNSATVALLVRKNSIEKKIIIKKKINVKLFKRRNALKIVNENLPKSIARISTTGMLSRELNEINVQKKSEQNTFMCVGGMGHAISVASGIALEKKKKVVCLDGDGAVAMHMGALATSSKNNNLIHIVFNNKSHDSVGGQPTATNNVSYFKLAKILGYKHCYFARNKKTLIKSIKLSIKTKKSTFIEILCSKGASDNLSRPQKKIIDYKNSFIKFLKKTN